MSSMNSQCEIFVPMLDAFVDNELDGSEKEQLAKHLSTCEDCKRSVEEIEALKATLSALPRRQMKFDLADNFDTVLAKQSPSGVEPSGSVVPFRSKRKWLVASASAAAVVVIVIAGAIVSKGDHQQVAQSNSSDQSKAVAVRGAGKSMNGDLRDGGDLSQRDPHDDNEQHEKVAVAPATGLPPKQSQKIAGAHLSAEPQRLTQDAQTAPAAGNNSAAPVVAHEDSSKTVITAAQSLGNRAGSSELLALYEDDDGISSDIGVSTDEDGLYAIKL